MPTPALFRSCNFFAQNWNQKGRRFCLLRPLFFGTVRQEGATERGADEMLTPTQSEFERLAGQGYNLIPVCREIVADLETPVSAFLKICGGDYSFLLESVRGGEKW